MRAMRSQSLRLIHKVGGDQHGDAVVGQRVDVRPELAPGHRIDPGGGLVENSSGGSCSRAQAKRQALAQAERQGFRLLIEPGARGKGSHHGVDPRLLVAAEQAVDTGEEGEVLGHGELLVEENFCAM